MTAEQLAQMLGDPAPEIFENYGPPYLLCTQTATIMCHGTGGIHEFKTISILSQITGTQLLQTLLGLGIPFEVL